MLKRKLRRGMADALRRAVRGPLVAEIVEELTHRILVDLARAPATYALVDRIVLHLREQPEMFLLVDRIVDYLVKHPEVQSLIHEQSKSLVEDAMGDLRSHAAHADDALGRLVSRFRGGSGAR